MMFKSQEILRRTALVRLLWMPERKALLAILLLNLFLNIPFLPFTWTIII